MQKQQQNSSPPTVQIYQFKITLKDTDPPIWRRFQVRDDTTLATLHEIVQFVMGWEDSHLHQFTWKNVRYGPLEGEFDMGIEDEEKVTLRSLEMKERESLAYEYDFGDGWDHKIVLEKILPPALAARYPVCLEGERACPPEDCGGAPGYENILRVLALPTKKLSEEDLDMLEWVGEDFDPEEFDVAAINIELSQFAPSRTGWVR